MKALLDSQALFDRHPDGLFLLTGDGAIVAANPAALDVLEVDRGEEVAGRLLTDFFPEPESTDWNEAFTAAAERGDTRACECASVGRRGGRRWLEIVVSPWHGIEDRGAGVLASARVSTTRRTVHDEDLGVEQFFRKAEKLALVGCFSHDLVTNRIVGTDALHRIFGQEPSEEVTLEKFRDRVHPEDRERVLAGIRAAIDSGVASFQIEYRVAVPKEPLRHVLALGHVMRDAQQKAVRVFGTVQDLTARKEIEEELHRHREAAERLSRRLSALQETTQELAKAESTDALCKLAVEEARGRCGFDRMSIWFVDEHRLALIGSFGTDENGSIRDERHLRRPFPCGDLAWRALAREEAKACVACGPILDHEGRPLGDGETATAALWDGTKAIGVIRVDNLLGGQPMQEDGLELLRLFATTLGHLITRKRIEEELRESQVLLDEAQRLAQVGYWVRDFSASRMKLSEEACRILGIPLADRVFDLEDGEQRWCEVVHPDDRERVRFADAAARDAGTPYHLEYRLCRADGEERTVHARGEVERDDAGISRRSFGFLQDITSSRRAEAALVAKDLELRRLAESSPGMMGTFHRRSDGTACMPYVSPRVRELFGLEAEDVARDATPLLARTHPDDAAGVEESIAESERTLKPWRHEYRVVHPTRGVLWLEGSSNPTPHPDGGVIWHGFVHDITDRKLAEESLRRSREHLSTLIDSVDGIVWEADAKTLRFTFVSPRAERLLGYPVVRWMQEPDFWVEHLHDEDRDRALRICTESTLAKNDHEFEYRMIAADGGIVWLRDIVTVVVEGGRPAALRGIMVDITRQKAAEQRIAQLNRTYAVLSEINQLIVRERDPNSMLEGACRIAVGIGGFPLAWVAAPADGDGSERLLASAGVDPEMEALLRSSLARAVLTQIQDSPEGTESKHAVCNDLAVDAPPGPWRDALLQMGFGAMVSFELVIGSRRAATFHLCTFDRGYFDPEELRLLEELALDISFALETCEGERERQRAIEQLRSSEERFRELAETINEVFWVTDAAKERMLYISPAYERIWGRSCHSLYAEPRSWMDAIHPDDRQRVSQAAATRQADGRYDEEYRIMRPDGSVRWIRDRAFPVRNAAGVLERIVGAAGDVTERRAALDQLRQAQKMDAIGQLAGGVAHDFNNILTAIMMQAQLTAQTPELAPEVRSGLEDIRAAVERAARLTRQLLLFSRRQVMQMRELNLCEVVTDLARMLQRIIGEDVRLHLRMHATPLMTRADAGMLEQVLLNLAVNARDAMASGGQLSIETSAREVNDAEASQFPDAAPGRYVSLSVSDTGTGIPPEVLPHIFEPFFTTKEAGKGTGLGLATVFGIVKQHGGWISVDSLPGKGTRISVFLSALESPGDVPSAVTPRREPRGGTETILLVEDEERVRMLTRSILTREGYRVIEAPNGVEALELWGRHRDEVQLLITDFVMPAGLTGQQLAARIHRERPQLKVIYTSGYSAETAGRELEMRPGENYLPKPFSAEQVLDAVRQCLDA